MASAKAYECDSLYFCTSGSLKLVQLGNPDVEGNTNASSGFCKASEEMACGLLNSKQQHGIVM